MPVVIVRRRVSCLCAGYNVSASIQAEAAISCVCEPRTRGTKCCLVPIDVIRANWATGNDDMRIDQNVATKTKLSNSI